MSSRNARKSVLAIILTLLFILPLASIPAVVASQQPGQGQAENNVQAAASMNITITPNTTSLDLQASIPVADKNLTMLNGNVSVSEDKAQGIISLTTAIQAFYKQLENVTGTLETMIQATASIDAANKTGTIGETTSTSINMTIAGGNGTLKIAGTIQKTTTTQAQNKTITSTSDTQTSLLVEAESQQETVTMSLNINATQETVATPNETRTTGSFQGPIAVTVPVSGFTTTINLNLDGHYEAVAMNNTLTVNATINITADNSLVAGILYQEITSIIQQYNLTGTVQATLNGNTITIVVTYSTTLNNTLTPGLGGIIAPGLPGYAQGNKTRTIIEHFKHLIDNTTLAPSNLCTGKINITASGDLTVQIENGTITVNSTIQVSAPQLLEELPYSIEHAQATLTLENTSQSPTIKVNAQATLGTPEPFTSIDLLQQAAWLALHAAEPNMTGKTRFNLTVNAENGVSLIVNGKHTSTVTFNNTTLEALQKIAVEYDGIIYNGANKPIIFTGKGNRLPVLPPTAKQIIIIGVGKAAFKLPYGNATILSNMTIKFGNETGKAKIVILKGARINQTLATAIITPENITLPPGYTNLQPAGYALAISNTTGTAIVSLKIEAPTSNIKILVIHDNGTTELINPLHIKAGMVVAVVSTHSVYIPVTQQSGGGGQETTTTTTTSTSPAATTTASTTSSPTTTSPTQTTTTTTNPPTTTGTTTSPATTSTTTHTTATTTTTSPTQHPTGTPGTTTTSSTGSPTSTTQNNTGSTQTGGTSQNKQQNNNQGKSQTNNKNNMIIISIIIILILIAAAALAFK